MIIDDRVAEKRDFSRFGTLRFAAFILLFPWILGSALTAQEPETKQEVRAQEEKKAGENPEPLSEDEVAQARHEKDALERLQDVQEMIIEKKREEGKLGSELSEDKENVELKHQLLATTENINNLEDDFEKIASGGLSIDAFHQAADEKFDWQADLLEVAKPLFDSLKKLSERPRAIETQRALVSRLGERRTESEQALANFANLKAGLEKMGPQTKTHFIKLEKKWQQHHDDVVRDHDVALFQLAQLLKGNTSLIHSISEGTAAFIGGRGRNILLALMVSILTYLLMRYLINRLKAHTAKKEEGHRVHIRLFVYSLHLLTSILVIIGPLMVFYTMGDWLLLGMMLIILLGLSIRLKDILPRLVSETQLMLNLGSIREGERVIYKGLPWLVDAINIQSRLVNPKLRGGQIRLNLAQLAELTSRPMDKSEPWFPCEEGQWLVFDNGMHCRVLLQTPDVVHLRTSGGTVHVWQTMDFLGMKPRNISLGTFGVVQNFAIALHHQDICTDKCVREAFDKQIREKFSGYRAGKYLESTMIEFKSASPNALNYAVRVDMNSGIDDDFVHVQRLANAACVEACNKNGWAMPIHQVVVTQSATVE